jgi:hypothetical protein
MHKIGGKNEVLNLLEQGVALIIALIEIAVLMGAIFVAGYIHNKQVANHLEQQNGKRKSRSKRGRRTSRKPEPEPYDGSEYVDGFHW